MHDFLTGLVLGLGAGVPVGVVWQDAFSLLKEALHEKKDAL